MRNAMAMIEAKGALLRAEDEGPREAPVILFSNSLGCSLEMWDAQAAHLRGAFRIIRYDNRGHGGSSVGDVPYSLDLLCEDALAVLDHFGVERAHWCGLSLGGMLGQRMAALHGHRLRSVILSNTTSWYPDATFWKDRIATVRAKGLAEIAAPILAGWLTEGFRQREPAAAARMGEMLLSTSQEGYLASCEAISVLDNRELLPKIATPTLVIAGAHDRSTPLSAAEAIVERIPGARLHVLEAAHISNVEQSAAFTREVENFLA